MLHSMPDAHEAITRRTGPVRHMYTATLQIYLDFPACLDSSTLCCPIFPIGWWKPLFVHIFRGLRLKLLIEGRHVMDASWIANP